MGLLRRSKMVVVLTGISGMGLLLGCAGLGDVLGTLFQSNRVTVVLNNTSDQFAVEANVLYDDQQETIATLLQEFGEELEFTILPGESVSFSRDCDELQAIMIDDADLLVLVGTGPDDETGVLRDGDDFGCGDTITFTFAHSALLIDFEIQVSIQ